MTPHSPFDNDRAENFETKKDEVSQFLSSRSEESSIAKETCNGLRPRDRHVSFNAIVGEISGQTEVLPPQGEKDNRTHTAPKRGFYRD